MARNLGLYRRDHSGERAGRLERRALAAPGALTSCAPWALMLGSARCAHCRPSRDSLCSLAGAKAGVVTQDSTSRIESTYPSGNPVYRAVQVLFISATSSPHSSFLVYQQRVLHPRSYSTFMPYNSFSSTPQHCFSSTHVRLGALISDTLSILAGFL